VCFLISSTHVHTFFLNWGGLAPPSPCPPRSRRPRDNPSHANRPTLLCNVVCLSIRRLNYMSFSQVFGSNITAAVGRRWDRPTLVRAQTNLINTSACASPICAWLYIESACRTSGHALFFWCGWAK
jgi:hypothetical protein